MAIATALNGTAAAAQQSGPPDAQAADSSEIVVTGIRGSAVSGIDPLATLDAKAIAATGATTIAELLRAIRSTTQAADGSDPIFLLNAQRVSGYQDIGTLPPEAIEKVEVLPELAALKFGYPPTRRLVNFITKRRFRQIEARATAGTTTRGGASRETANLGLTRLRNDSRLTVAMELRHTDPLLQAARNIVPDPNILFEAVGNVVGNNRNEIDPALSAAAGGVVTVAPVPDTGARPPTLADFAAGANRPRLFDLGPYRTLVPRNDAVKGETVVAGKIGSLGGTLSLSAEQSRDRILSGPSVAVLAVPDTSPYSPFGQPVLLDRYLTEAALLRIRQTTTTLHAGAIVRGAIAGWRWDLSATLDQVRIAGRSDRGVDLTAATAAIAAGANPFAPIDPALLTTRIVDVAQSRTRTGGLKAVATNTPFRVPAGTVSVTATAEAERATATSFTRGNNPYDLDLARDRVEGTIALDVPLASRREHVLAFVGDLSVNASATARDVSGFGALYDTSYGLTWGPLSGVQLLVSARNAGAAPPLAQQATPEVRVANVPVFDYGSGRTDIVTLIQGGNPDLRASHRRTRALTLNAKPFAAREWRMSATYEATTIRDQTGTVYALTPLTEAVLPGLATRDASGRLVSVAFRPINFFRERQRTLNLTLSANGRIGRPPKPVAAQPPADARLFFYAGIGPTYKFADRLQLRAGAPALDLLRGDTVLGSGMPRASGYAYGGINQGGNGLTFDAWYGGANRVRSPNPAADLRFAPIFKLNLGSTIALNSLLKQKPWAKGLQLKIDINNVTDARQRVRDGNGATPNRFQPDYLDPVGRLVSMTLRKLF